MGAAGPDATAAAFAATRGTAICGAACAICSEMYLGTSDAADNKPFSLYSLPISAAVIPGVSSGTCDSALIASICLRVASVAPTAAVAPTP